jgi:hypothetical protein
MESSTPEQKQHAQGVLRQINFMNSSVSYPASMERLWTEYLLQLLPDRYDWTTSLSTKVFGGLPALDWGRPHLDFIDLLWNGTVGASLRFYSTQM